MRPQNVWIKTITHCLLPPSKLELILRELVSFRFLFDGLINDTHCANISKTNLVFEEIDRHDV